MVPLPSLTKNWVRRSYCCGWDLEYSPKAYVFKDLSPACGAVGDGGTLRSWGLVGGPQVTEGVLLKGTVKPQPFFHSSAFQT